MSRKPKGDFGRTSRVPVITFRVSAVERATLEGEAGAAEVTVNELARRRTLQLPDADLPAEETPPAVSTRIGRCTFIPLDDAASEPDAPAVRELTLHRDEESQ